MSALASDFTALKGKRVYFDTNPVIYYLEQISPFFSVVQPFFEMIGQGDIVACTSEFTLLETLIKPMRDNATLLIDDIQELLLDPDLFSLIPVSREILLLSAELGAKSGLKPADSIHFASAIHHQCDYFVTNDLKFQSQQGVDVLRLSDFLEPPL